MIEILTSILAAISVAASAATVYVLYRQKELISLAIEVITAYEDKNISEEEYGKIVQKLKDVIYKK